MDQGERTVQSKKRDRRWRNQYMDLILQLPDYIIPCPEDRHDLDGLKVARERLLTAAAGREIVLEFGSGSGNHLIKQALAHPEWLVIGFELRFKRVFRTAEKAKERGINNLLVLQCDALRAVDLFLPQSLAGIFVNFPDPWSKPRWQKHRLLNERSLVLFSELLKPGGFLSYKTDHRQYFDATLRLLTEIPVLRSERLTYNLIEEPIDDHITTEFEELFRSKNQPIHYLYARKCPTAVNSTI